MTKNGVNIKKKKIKKQITPTIKIKFFVSIYSILIKMDKNGRRFTWEK